MSLLPFLHRVVRGSHLETAQAYDAMSIVLDGAASTPQIAAFLVALHMNGETADELVGFARAMRERVTPVKHGLDTGMLLDTCGTGGAGLKAFNISTVSAFVVAGAGARVAKHGNRSISSRCGSADVLEALGIDVNIEVAHVARAIREVGIGFLFAPALHPAMKHAHQARLELKMQTVFNLLGPLTNPAGAQSQLIGAPSMDAAELMAKTLAGLGTGHAFVVHGFDGLDEISTSGPTMVYEIAPERFEKHIWTPADFGVPRASVDAIAGGDRDTNAQIAREVLAGKSGPHRDIVLVNAAAALLATGSASDLRAGVSIAAQSIDSGAAAQKVEQLAAFTTNRK